MKKPFLIAGILCFMNTVFAQQAVDALSFSQAYYHLTARSAAMGGASGALKSDFGAIAVNPAAIATYKTSELTFTPEFYSVLSKTNYEGQVNSKYRNDVSVNQVGIVYSFQTRKSPTRYNIGFSYNKLNAFNTNELIQNVAVPINDSYWGQIANQENLRDIKFVDEMRRHSPTDQKYLFEENGSLPGGLLGTNVDQRALYSTAGFLGEYALSFGVNLSEKVYIGASAVVRDVAKSSVYELFEESLTDADYRYSYARKYETLGLGFGGKLGVFILPVPEFSIGISVQSPIFYSITQRTEGTIKIPPGAASELQDGAKGIPYQSELPETKYSLITPLQATISFSYAIQNIALLTLDYEMTPYAMAQYSNTEGDAAILDASNALLKESNFGSSVRLGSEFYVWKGLVARLGGGYHTAPSSDIKSTFNVGVGAGYNFGDVVIDLAYVYRTQKQHYPLYTNSSPVEATYTKNFITLSLAYRF
ncbi:MAG: hypothetical protein LBF39_03815 [Prevotellaceae bacterium]|jgi:hypothetical protein|nr:hypothetical protein [Prevotellaceae bacterium]